MKLEQEMIELRLEEFHVNVQIPIKSFKEMIPGARVRGSVNLSPYSDHLNLRMAAFITGNPLCDVYESWPKDWWQAFRKRWFPAWWLSRWPVQEKSIKIKASELATKMILPEKYGPVNFMKVDRSWIYDE